MWWCEVPPWAWSQAVYLKCRDPAYSDPKTHAPVNDLTMDSVHRTCCACDRFRPRFGYNGTLVLEYTLFLFIYFFGIECCFLLFQINNDKEQHFQNQVNTLPRNKSHLVATDCFLREHTEGQVSRRGALSVCTCRWGGGFVGAPTNPQR